MFKGINFKVLAEKFCRAPLPDSVCADPCATRQGPGRTGTNLLSVEQAESVFRGIFEDDAASDKALRLDIHILLDTLATAARGQPIDPDTCEVIEAIVKAHRYEADFDEDDIQALYDCGFQSVVATVITDQAAAKALVWFNQANWDQRVPEVQTIKTVLHEKSIEELDDVELLKIEIRRLKRLFHIAEECGEVIKAASKSARFGEDYKNPATGDTNKHELKQEAADLAAVIDEVVECRDAEYTQMKEQKVRKTDKWKVIEEECLAEITKK